jgi:hypothetical protein
VNHRTIRPNPLAKTLAKLAVCAVPALALAAGVGCAGGYETVDGSEAVYVSPPPPAVVENPAYRVHDGYVYENSGHYYHMHEGRWVMYRSLPHDAVRVEGRALHQR